MLRTLVVAVALLAPGYAMAEQLPESPMGLPVRAEGNVTLAQIEAVERNAAGQITAVQAPGLEPADAPNARRDRDEQLMADDGMRALRAAFRNESQQQLASRDGVSAR